MDVNITSLEDFHVTYHVYDSQDTCTISNLFGNSGKATVRPVDANDTESNVRSKVKNQEDKLEPSWKSPDVERSRELNFLVVSLASNGGIPDALLERGPVSGGYGEVSLGIIVEASHLSNVLD